MSRRKKRLKWGKWTNDAATRQEHRTTLPEVPRHRSRKDTRRWCRGKVGVEHQTEVRLDRPAWKRDDVPDCYRPEWWPSSWWCNHQEVCTVCNKILRWSLERDCPRYTEAVTQFWSRRS